MLRTALSIRKSAHLRLSVFLLFFLPVFGGCVTATVQQVREASTGLEDTEAIVVLAVFSKKTRKTPKTTIVEAKRLLEMYDA